jgi:hypothetical protein
VIDWTNAGIGFPRFFFEYMRDEVRRARDQASCRQLYIAAST